MASKQKNKKSAPATAKESKMQQSEEAYAYSVAGPFYRIGAKSELETS